MELMMLILLLCALFLFLIAPRMWNAPDHSRLMGYYYAHRGLHDNASAAPENSMAAFRKAADAGYGIELDVQLTRDRIPVVFHDESLQRVCGVDGNVRDYTYAELQAFPLFASEERIPLFQDVLTEVSGRVPLIIEIKIHEQADEVCSTIDPLIAAYSGPYCIESFHPLAVVWYRRHRPTVIRGQLSCQFERSGPALTAVQHLLTNFGARPDFIAYDHHQKKNLSRRLCRGLFRALSVAWTVKSQAELDACRRDYDLFIFEGFLPE